MNEARSVSGGVGIASDAEAALGRVADQFKEYNYDPFVLFDRLRAGRRGRLDAAQARGSWIKWASHVRARRRVPLWNLYVNVPFCAKRCDYCMHFSTRAPGPGGMERYLRALIEQARYFAPALEGLSAANSAIGGGTPNLLSADQIARLCSALNESYSFDPAGERTFEAHPVGLDERKLAALREGGINRLSLGVQSMNPRVLAAAGRTGQTPELAARAVSAARRFGFPRGVSVDLILGLAEEDADDFYRSFEQAAACEPDMIFVNVLRPVPGYVEKRFAGEAARAAAHVERAASAIARCEALARRLGYETFLSAGQEFVCARPGHDAGDDRSRYFAGQTAAPYSTLALGWGASSHVRGERVYDQVRPFAESFDPSAELFEGAWIDEREEMAKSLTMTMRNRRCVLWSELEEWFGRDVRDEFGPEVEELSRLGWISSGDGRLSPKAADARTIMLTALKLVGKDGVERMLRENPCSDDGAGAARGRMRNVEINLGMACNNRCAFCMSGDPKMRAGRWMPFEAAQEELRRFRDMGCESVGFLGGEPTAYPRIVDIVRRARELGYRRVALCTNGMKLSDEKFVESLLDAGATRFAISFHSRDAAVEDEITAVPGNFARKLKGLLTLIEHRREGRLADGLSLNPVLSRRTYRDIVAYVEFFRAAGVRDIRFNYIWPQFLAQTDRAWVPSYREAMPILLRAILLNEKRWKMTLSFGGVPPCMLRWANAGVSERTRAHLAGRYFDEQGVDLETRVSANAMRFDWRRQKRERLKTHGPKCRECAWFERCDGVWKTYAEMWGLDEMTPLEVA